MGADSAIPHKAGLDRLGHAVAQVPDCLVIGGGLMGLLTALELRDAGLSVTLLERGAAGREASWAGGGILSPLYPWRQPDAITRLSSWSQRAYPHLAETVVERGDVDPEWTRSGLLTLGAEDHDTARDWAARGGTCLEHTDARAVTELVPGLGDPGPGLWLPEVAQIRNPRLARGLRATLLAAGVTLIEDCAVHEVQARGRKVAGVVTARGKFPAGRVVVAAGAWSAGLLAPLGFPLAVEPVRGQMILFRAAPGLVSPIVLRRGHYIIPRRDGRILAGSTLEHAGFDKATTPEAERTLHAAALALLPALAEVPVERHWAGLRPGSPAGIPFIGEHPDIQGLYVNSGHYRNGVVLAPASARLLSELILEITPIIDPAPYRLEAARPEALEA
ncbi:MAG: glycine oxidase ThiO [Gammaproteobacteria bacterium]